VLGHPEWVADPRFATNAARVENRAALCGMIDEIFVTRSKGEWIDLLEAEGVPCSIINSLPEAAAHPQAAALDMIQPMPGDDFSLMALPVSFDGARPRIRRAPPGIGEHDAEIAKSGGAWPR
jgi:formyl-CoA transferase